MKRIERTLSIILLVIISFSNVSAPFAYAAETVVAKIPPPAKPSTTPVVPPKFKQPDNGSVLGASTSLLVVGSGGSDVQTSASKRVPIRMQQLPKKVYQTNEDVIVSVVNPDNDPFATAVLNANGQTANVPISESNNGTTTTVQLASSNEINPGQYVVKITDDQGNVTTQDFSWGVLALNTDKTMYDPGENADISMAVLDNTGDMVCDASLELQITNQAAGINDLLSTSIASSSATTSTASSSAQATTASSSATTNAGTITVNPQCQKHDFSLQPDYETHYTFTKAGTYTLQLTATTGSGNHTITDTVPVTNNIPFDVQRVSATRIYPLDTYPMTFNITAHQDFNGTVTETVPQDFTITPATGSAQTNSYDNMQTVYLNANDPAAELQQAINASSSGGLVMPFHGDYPITQGFGAQMTDPTLQAFYTQYGLAGHDGVDFGVPMDTPLYAVDDGNVIWSGPGDYGVTIIIQHSWGESYYGHLSTTAVTVGTHVTKGQLIGYSGESGEATGPHLHFGMRPNNPDMKNGYYGKVDPLPYLPYGHQEEDTSALGPAITPTPSLSASTVLSASTSADDASDSAVLSPTVSPIPTAILTPSSAPQASVSSILLPSPTGTEQTAPTPSVQPPTPTPVPNSNFSVLDKQIQENEALTNASNTEEVKVITWHVTLKKGDSTTLGYDYQAPHVSPQFYLLGPMQFYANGSNKVVFQEQRQWEVASDDVGVEWYSNTTGNKWNGYSWQYRKKIDISHSEVSSSGIASVTEDQTANTQGTALNTDLTWNATVSSTCTNALLIVATSTDYNGSVNNYITYGGTHMTELTTMIGSNEEIEVWYMLDRNLTTLGKGTAHTVDVNFQAGSRDEVGGSVSFCNVDQTGTGTFGAEMPTSGSGTGNVTESVTTTSTNQMVFAAMGGSGGAGSYTANHTALWNDVTAAQGAAQYVQGVSGTTTMSWTPGATATWAEIAVPINVAIPNFPVLVDISGDAQLSANAQSSGADILFTDSTGENLLKYEIESYSSGTLVAWVGVPALSASNDTIIYMYYGNPSAASLANASGVWDSNYIGVYHLGTSGTNNDSTSYGNTATNPGGTGSPTLNTSGKIGNAQTFPDSSADTLNYLLLPASTTMNAFMNNANYTISAWLNPAGTPPSNGEQDYFAIGKEGYTTGLAYDHGDEFYNIAWNSTDNEYSTGETTTSPPGSWYYVQMVVDSSKDLLLYVNGVSQAGPTTLAGSFYPYGTEQASIGEGSYGDSCTTNLGNYPFCWNGGIDEMELSNTARSTGWIDTEYNNQNAPGSFYSVGNQETSSYAPTMAQLMRHGEWFSAEGAVQPFTF